MGVQLLHSCDYQGIDCPNTDVEQVEFTVDSFVYRADICGQHREELGALLREVGMRPVATVVDHKRRDVLVAASGAPFSAAQVRAWLAEQGLASGASTGRVANAHLDAYAAAH